MKGQWQVTTVNKIRDLWEKERWRLPPDEMEKLIADVKIAIQ
jgi:hypothetical protein